MTLALGGHVPTAAPTRAGSIASALTIGLRELRNGIRGFGIFIACVALGVAVIAAVGTLSDGLRAGFERQGEAILGGDMTFARMHVRATPDERSAIDKMGTTSETATMRTMARRLDGSEQALAELKGVDASYPLAGELVLADGKTLQQSVISEGGAAVDAILLERLGLKLGDAMRIGETDVPVSAILKTEPDAIADRLTYGPRVMVSTATLDRTQLVKPGTLVRWRYAVRLADRDPAAIDRAKLMAAATIPEAGFTTLDRRNPAPSITRTLERLRQFLTLIGLASLLVGGVGVANAVGTFIDRRLKVIATLKTIGATRRQVFAILLVQVLIMAAVGVGLGLLIGSVSPPLIGMLIGDALPIEAEFGVSIASLATAAAYGFLVALLFSIWPLGRAEAVAPSVLVRNQSGLDYGAGQRPRNEIIVLTAVTAIALGSLAIFSSDSKTIAMSVLAGLGVALAVFSAIGFYVTRLARRIKRPRQPELAIALGNLGSPNGLARSVVVSLGIGLTLLVAVSLTDAALVDELKTRLPDKSPDYFLLDIPKTDIDGLQAKVAADVPGTIVSGAPMLRGRLVKLKDKPVETISAPPEAQWVLTGDRGLSYAADLPSGSKIVAGEWWGRDYGGPPLVSFEAELAHKLNLKVGDRVVVNVLGRNVEATIANLREVKWETLAINFVMLFSPNTMKGAPHNLLATLTLPPGTARDREISLVRNLAKAYPAVSAIRVKDAIDQFNVVFAKVMTAVRVAGGITLLSGSLVLAGALATAQRRRIVEAVILKTLGATRRRILGAHLAEYLLLSVVAAIVAAVLGSFAAWLTVVIFMDIEFSLSIKAIAQAIVLSVVLITALGLAGTWSVLKARPVPYLRSE